MHVREQNGVSKQKVGQSKELLYYGLRRYFCQTLDEKGLKCWYLTDLTGIHLSWYHIISMTDLPIHIHLHMHEKNKSEWVTEQFPDHTDIGITYVKYNGSIQVKSTLMNTCMFWTDVINNSASDFGNLRRHDVQVRVWNTCYQTSSWPQWLGRRYWIVVPQGSQATLACPGSSQYNFHTGILPCQACNAGRVHMLQLPFWKWIKLNSSQMTGCVQPASECRSCSVARHSWVPFYTS